MGFDELAKWLYSKSHVNPFIERRLPCVREIRFSALLVSGIEYEIYNYLISVTQKC